MGKLTALGAKNAASGKHEDGAGLRLVKTNRASGKWVLRITVHGRRREMGLGPWPGVSLSEARGLADDARAHVRAGRDPIQEREKARREAERNLHVLADVAADCFEARRRTLKGDGTAGRWLSPLTLHVLPKLGRVPVGQIDQVAIRGALQGIWRGKPETARKSLQRLGVVMRHAAALGLDVDVQAVEKAKALLGAQDDKPQHIEALAWRELPEFWQRIEAPTPVHLALKLLILTGQRSAPVRLARAEEFDLEAATWTIPGENLKGKKGATADVRVPLCDAALDVIRAALPLARGGNLFVGPRGKAISDMAMSKRMKDMGYSARPHGFRSSFRSWAEETSASWNVAEAVLGHAVGNRVERSYQRSDLFEQRAALLGRWASVVTGEDRGDVVPMRGRG